MRDWHDLSVDEQLALREAYGRDPACQTATCSMDAKISMFSKWLSDRGVRFTASDLGRREGA